MARIDQHFGQQYDRHVPQHLDQHLDRRRDGAEPCAPIAGLLLAAGGGRRLGGRPKALLPHTGRPLVEHAVRALREGGCTRVYVVLGAAREEVRARARLDGCVRVDNPEWDEGMGTSLRAGLERVTEDRTAHEAARADAEAPDSGSGFGAVLVSLVDQPGIGAAAVARVRGAYTSPRTLAAATYGGRRGHPVLLGADHWAGVRASARGDVGARGYLGGREEEIARVECGDIADPADIDTPEDLARLTP